MEERTAGIQIERGVSGEGAGTEDGQNQHDHLPDFEALVQSIVAEESAAQKDKDAQRRA